MTYNTLTDGQNIISTLLSVATDTVESDWTASKPEEAMRCQDTAPSPMLPMRD